jgi:hypothetical protein
VDWQEVQKVRLGPDACAGVVEGGVGFGPAPFFVTQVAALPQQREPCCASFAVLAPAEASMNDAFSTPEPRCMSAPGLLLRGRRLSAFFRCVRLLWFGVCFERAAPNAGNPS